MSPIVYSPLITRGGHLLRDGSVAIYGRLKENLVCQLFPFRLEAACQNCRIFDSGLNEIHASIYNEDLMVGNLLRTSADLFLTLCHIQLRRIIDYLNNTNDVVHSTQLSYVSCFTCNLTPLCS